jgi:hypothetical protein
MATRGGKRKGAGRKSKAEEQKLIEKLSPLEALAHKKLKEAIEKGQNWAIRMYFEYMYGKPKESIDHTSGGEVINTPVIKFFGGDSDT